MPNMSAGGRVSVLVAELVLLVVELSSLLPQAASTAPIAVEPPVSAMNLRRETGSLASLAIALLDASIG